MCTPVWIPILSNNPDNHKHEQPTYMYICQPEIEGSYLRNGVWSMDEHACSEEDNIATLSATLSLSLSLSLSGTFLPRLYETSACKVAR